MKDIDFALVEGKRPPMYTAMKYWGKKPHNIWGEYIENYTEENGLVLDPFCGSAISAFEAVKCGKKAIAFDINPLTSFIIDVYSTEFNKDAFIKSVNSIVEKVERDCQYNILFTYECPCCGNKHAVMQHAKWDKNKIYEIGIICNQCNSRNLIKTDTTPDFTKTALPYWYPTDRFHLSPSFSDSFIKNIGGNSFDCIWTKRNLYTLSMIFHEILNQKDACIKKQLLFGFIQSVHLASKMCVPRREKSNRSYSTSWGRAAYICSARQMEMNPLLLFKNNCIGKQSVQSALTNVKKHLGKTPKALQIQKGQKYTFSEDYDIFYGIVDIKEINDILPQKSISFIITDPPYGGLIQYIDLSLVWLVWLKHFNPIYTPDINNEITVKKGIKNIEAYNKEFTQGIKNLHALLKDNGKIVFTFHNKNLNIWNAFLCAIDEAGFKIENIIHQQNRRTGESNVSDPYGTSASDFYIRCSKSAHKNNAQTTKEEFEAFIIERTVKIIQMRNEPTPYQTLFNGLLSEISKAGFNLNNFDANIQKILKSRVNSIFEIVKTKELYGDLWWLSGKPIKNTDGNSLTDRVCKTIEQLYDLKPIYTAEEIISQIFIKYSNGLTPDIRNIEKLIGKYAIKSGNKWIKRKVDTDVR